MGRTTFSGPVASDNGMETDFVKFEITTTAALPAASASIAGQMRIVSDNGVGNNEYCVVICTGSAWVTAAGAALS